MSMQFRELAAQAAADGAISADEVLAMRKVAWPKAPEVRRFSLIVLFTVRKRALHDMISGLVLVRRRALTPPSGYWNNADNR